MKTRNLIAAALFAALGSLQTARAAGTPTWSYTYYTSTMTATLTKVTAAEARLKTVFGVEGADTLNESAFSSDNVGLALAPTGDGRLKATVTPPVDAGDAYFMRLKVR